MLGDEVALGIVDAAHGAPHLPAEVVGVYVHTFATAHVAHSGEIPSLDALARSGIVEYLAEHVAGILLYGKGLEARALGVDVAGAEAVAMGNTGGVEGRAVMVHRVAACLHLVAAVAVDIGNTYLMEGGASGVLAEELLPLTGLASAEIEGKGTVVVVVAAVAVACVPLHDHGGVYAVGVEYAHVPHVLVVLVAHECRAVGAVV